MRDLVSGDWNVDTLMILTSKEHMAEVLALAWTWDAAQVESLHDEEVAYRLGVFPPGDQKILRVWWDYGKF